MERLRENQSEITADRESDQTLLKSSEDEEDEYEGNAELLEAPDDENCVSCDEPRILSYNPPMLISEDINMACHSYIKKHIFYGSKFLKEMTIEAIKNDNAFHYMLETFCEQRKCALVASPYYGQDIDGPENGPSPNPWDISVLPPAMFQEGKAKIEIPHTAFVQRCDVCFGGRHQRCVPCYGMGYKSCSSCRGSGQNGNRCCSFCSGTGRKGCCHCNGTGHVRCLRCNSRGNLKYCRMLIVKWLKSNDDFVSNAHNLPPKRIKKATGSEILSEEQKMLTPIKDAPDETINEASLTMIRCQKETSRCMRILRQRHVLRSVPLTRVFYEWQGKRGEFYVYGEEKKVFFQKYPQKCSCCTCL